MIRFTYKEVLEVLEKLGPATTHDVFAELESRRFGPHWNNSGPRRRRRRWVWQALLNLAHEGKVTYVIESGETYVWTRVPKKAKVTVG